MRRCFPVILLTTAAAGLLAASGRAALDKNWSTITGRIVWGGEKIPEVGWLETKMQQCVAGNPRAKGTEIPDEKLLVNAKNKGIQDVFVYILVDADDKLPIHPTLKGFPKEVVLDQPACTFIPRASVLREGQTFVVRNSAPFPHNINWGGDLNMGGNVLIPPGKKHEIDKLKMERLPLRLTCNLHPWMSSRLLVVNHPYYAITDADGSFEMKLAPVGKYKMMIYHPELGYRTGFKAKFGEDVTIVPGETRLGELKMGSDSK